MLNLVGLLLACAVSLCGYQYFDIYYNHYHLESGLFPKSTTDYFVYGGYTAFRTAAALLGDGTHSNVPRLIGSALLAAVGIALYACGFLLVIQLLGKSFRRLFKARNTGDRVRQSANKLRNHLHVKIGALALLGSLGGFAIWIVTGLAIVLYMAVPALVAQYAAKLDFRAEQGRLAANCPQAMSDTSDVCMEVRDAEQRLVARGFIIASSPGYVALEEHNRVQLVSLQNRQLVQLEVPPSR